MKNINFDFFWFSLLLLALFIAVKLTNLKYLIGPNHYLVSYNLILQDNNSGFGNIEITIYEDLDFNAVNKIRNFILEDLKTKKLNSQIKGISILNIIKMER